jgi:DNA polymerase III subunit gamma/tau
MAYQVLARRWRPKRFDEVVGQRGVTQTLRNAIASNRIAQAFVFAGPRGVGKTTTARILARALNCVAGPVPDPCGVCEPCVEIAEGRDIDVLEIDAATHTQVENVREVIIAGLALAPVRNRYKVFLIDEVHQLSSHSFNALLKSIEEPPPHVVFMMATTELGKIPDTILSRSQVFEFRTIGTKAIADQLRAIAQAEGIEMDEGALALVARSAEGSMRDAQSALDQVIAFAGTRITTGDVSTVLGLVGRDLLFDIAGAVVSEDAAAMFELAARATEAGHDLRVVCRELARLVRDLLVLSVDASRFEDPEIAPERDRERLRALAARFSREDLLRAFDVLARAEFDMRAASQPRYHLEMALLRWVHLRKLVPLSEIIERWQKADSVPAAGGASGPATSPGRSAGRPEVRRVEEQIERTAPPGSRTAPSGNGQAGAAVPSATVRSDTAPVPEAALAASSGTPGGALKDAILAEINRTRKSLFGTVISKAHTIEVTGEEIVFGFAPEHRHLRMLLEQNRPGIEGIATQLAARKMKLVTVEGAAPASASSPVQPPDPPPPDEAKRADLKVAALADAGVQALLEVFPAEIRDVEEL